MKLTSSFACPANSAIAGVYLSASNAAYLSTLYDVGGIAGSIISGFLSDKLRAPGFVLTVFFAISICSLFLYRFFGNVSYSANIILLVLNGIVISGPVSLISSAVAADLGNHESLKGNKHAISTTVSIINGTGSLGAAIGPFLAGVMPSWDATFYLLMASGLVAAACLSRITLREVRGWMAAAPGNSSSPQRDIMLQELVSQHVEDEDEADARTGSSSRL